MRASPSNPPPDLGADDERTEIEFVSGGLERPVGVFDTPPLTADEALTLHRFGALCARDRRLVLAIVRRVMEIEDEGGEDLAQAMVERVMLMVDGADRLS